MPLRGTTDDENPVRPPRPPRPCEGEGGGGTQSGFEKALEGLFEGASVAKRRI